LKTRRGHERFIRRLETEFTAENKNYRGISSDLSISGLFIRSNHAFVPDTQLDIVIHLPDSTDVKLKGRVRRAIKTPIVSLKNGMGVEITENDPRYLEFVKTVIHQNEPAPEEIETGNSSRIHVEEPPPAEPPLTEFTIITCPRCGIRNKVRLSKLALSPICGKCRSPLTAQA
jgi:hypothetical protein